MIIKDMTVYIAGPMRGYPRYNFDAFDEATRQWRQWCGKVISPAEMDRNAGFDPDSEVEITQAMKREFMRRDLVAITQYCDAIALLPGWEKSAGVKVEKALAEFLGLPVYDATTGNRVGSSDSCHNVAEPTLEVGQVFGIDDPEVTKLASKLQAAGAEFEFKHDISGMPWTKSNDLSFGMRGFDYVMVSPPPESKCSSYDPDEFGVCVNCKRQARDCLADTGTFRHEYVRKAEKSNRVQYGHACGRVDPVADPGQLVAGDRQKFSTGAVRSSDANGTRYDLISHIGLRRIAETYAEGAIKYDDNNWLKGFPASDVMNHCIKHIYQWLSGDGSEDHLAHAAWNLITVMHFEESRPDLIDCYHRQKQGASDG